METTLKFTKDHEWLCSEGQNVKIGVTTFAVEQLGDIVHLELPEVGAEFDSGESFGTIESTKTVSDLYMPVKGKVLKINEELVESPEKIQDSKDGEAWLIELSNQGSSDELMTKSEYTAYIKE